MGGNIYIFHFICVNLIFLVCYVVKKENWIIKATYIYSLFIFGQRWMCGTDFPNYLRAYIGKWNNSEVGYRIIQNIFKEMNFSFTLITFTILAATIYLNYKLILKLTKYKYLAIYLYMISEIYFAQMSQIRQYLAISIFGLAFYYSYHKEYKKTIIFFLIAMLFHKSVILVGIFLFIKLRLKNKEIKYLLGVICILPMVDLSYFIKFTPYVGYLDSKFAVGLSNAHYFKYYYIVIGGIITFKYLSKKRNINNINQNIIINGFLLNCILYGLSFKFALIFRMANYFKIFEIILMCVLIENLKKQKEKILIFLIILIGSLGIYFFTARIDSYNITKYEFRMIKLFEKQNDKDLLDEIEHYGKQGEKND